MTNGERPSRQSRYPDRMPTLDTRQDAGDAFVAGAFRTLFFSLLATATLVANAVARDAPARPASPSELFGELYVRVETEHLFPDSKTFADAVPLKSPDAILSAYRAQAPRTKAALEAFVRSNFAVPKEGSTPLPASIRNRRASL